MSKTLQIDRVHKRFGDFHALNGVELEIRPGEFFTLLGPSGCGKTTLLRIVAGLELATSGRVLLGGEDLIGKPANQRPVNTVFQSYALFPHLSVFENVAFGLRSRHVADGDVKRRVADALELTRLAPFATRMPHQLSGGQRQRVALARALVNEPEVLLLDEPMSALDAKLRHEVQVELRRLQQRLGTTFILVTHDQDEAMAVSDRIALMRSGELEQVGTPSEVYATPRTCFAAEFLGAANLIACDQTGQTVFGRLDFLQQATRQPGWTNGHVAIRPEHLRVHHENPNLGNTVAATVQDSVYRGTIQEVFFRPTNASSLELRARISPDQLLHKNQTVWLELPPSKLVVLHD